MSRRVLSCASSCGNVLGHGHHTGQQPPAPCGCCMPGGGAGCLEELSRELRVLLPLHLDTSVWLTLPRGVTRLTPNPSPRRGSGCKDGPRETTGRAVPHAHCPGAEPGSGLLVQEAAEPGGGARAVTPGVSCLALTGGGHRAAVLASLGLTFFPF